MRIHQPQPPGRSSAFLIPYPPFCFRGWIAGKGSLEVGALFPLPALLGGRLVYLQHSRLRIPGCLLPLLQHGAEVTRQERGAKTSHHCPYPALSAHKTSRVPSSQLQVNGQTIKHTAQKLSPKDLTLFRRTWGKFKLKGGLENSTNLVVNN